MQRVNKFNRKNMSTILNSLNSPTVIYVTYTFLSENPQSNCYVGFVALIVTRRSEENCKKAGVKNRVSDVTQGGRGLLCPPNVVQPLEKNLKSTSRKGITIEKY